MWKKSIKFRLSLVFCLIIIIICLLNIAISNTLLGDYYTDSKREALLGVYNDIAEFYEVEISEDAGEDLDDEAEAAGEDAPISSDFGQDRAFRSDFVYDTELSEEIELKIEQLSMNKNFSILIYRDIASTYSVFFGGNAKFLLYSSFGSEHSDTIESNNLYSDYTNGLSDAVVLESADNYEISQIDVRRLDAQYLYLEGELYNGDHILIRTSLAAIAESVNWVNHFFFYLALICGGIGLVIMYICTDRLVRPVTKLTAIARQMAGLDFSARYEGKREDEIGILGDSINTMSESLQEAMAELKQANAELRRDLEQKEKTDSMRKEFLSNVSHELKTPIALIQGYAEGLMEGINDDEESREFYCEVIVDEAHKMNEIVKKIIALNQLEFGYGNISMERFDVTAVIRGLLAKSEILLNQKNVQVRFDCDHEVPVWSDVYMTEEVFNNYFSNAMNHIDEGGRLEISLEEKGDTVRVSVYNSGSHIPEEDLPHIWEKFYKVDKARTREYGGSGVGLSIVKASMDLLGQAYGAENREDGVCFWFELDTRSSLLPKAADSSVSDDREGRAVL